MDYSDMNYYDIVDLLNQYNYTLPVVASDFDGNQTILTDGWTDTSYDHQAVKLHYFKLVTYLPDGCMQTDLFSADGLHSVHIQPLNEF